MSNVAIALCTYRRPDGLARVLSHAAKAVARHGQHVSIIVVDNDGSDPRTSEIVEEARLRDGSDIDLYVDTTSGISAARNAIITEVDKREIRFLAMLDDDEWPADDWLTALLERQGETGASVVGGPVTPVFPEDEYKMHRYARFWSVAPQTLEGRTFVFCTCNFLLDLDAVRDVPRPFFPLELGHIGSEDVTFFRNLFYRGLTMAWAESALMYEEVTPERSKFSWLRRRRFLVGNQAVGWETIDKGRFWPLAKTLAVTGRLAFYPLLRREPEAPLVGWLLMAEQIRGRYAAHFGRKSQGYARPDSEKGPVKACR